MALNFGHTSCLNQRLEPRLRRNERGQYGFIAGNGIRHQLQFVLVVLAAICPEWGARAADEVFIVGEDSAFNSDRVYRFSGTGAFLSEFTAGSLLTTVTTNGTNGFAGDFGSGAIIEFQPDGTVVGTFANPSATMGDDVSKLETDAAGNLYVNPAGFSSQPRTSVRLNSSGAIAETFSHADLVFPRGIDADSDGNVYIVNSAGVGVGNVIFKFSPLGSFINSTSINGQVSVPADMAIDEVNRLLYVADEFGGSVNVKVYDISGAQPVFSGTIGTTEISGALGVSFDADAGTILITSSSGIGVELTTGGATVRTFSGGSLDRGRDIVRIGGSGGGGGGSDETHNSTDVPKAIPDGPGGTVTSTIVVPPTTIITSIADVDVNIDITHTFDGDLDVFLESPSGTVVELFTGVGSGGNNFTGTVLDDEAATPITAGSAPFSGSFQPEGSLTDFDGQSAIGTWTLTITDQASADVGTLNSWSLELGGGSDTDPPSVSSITRSGASPTNDASVDFTIVFDEAMNSATVDTADFVVDATGVTGAAITGVSGSGTTYTVSVSTGSGNGTLSIDLINNGSIEDLAGNALSASFTAGEAYVIDKTPPAITIGAPSPLITNTGPVSFTVTYSGASSITLSPGDVAVNTTGTASGIVDVSGTGTIARTVTVQTITGDGSISFSIAGGTATDAAGNVAGTAGPSSAFTVDNTPPSVSISAPSASITASGPITYLVTYSGANTVSLTTGDINLNSTGTATGSVAVSGSGTTFRTVAITNVAGDGTLAISIDAATAADAAGNLAAAAGPSALFSADNTAPVVTMTPLTTTDSSPALTGTVDDTTASLSVTVDGQTLPALNFGTGSWSLSDNQLTPLAPGTYDVQVTATDAAGNAGTDTTNDELVIESGTPETPPAIKGVITSNPPVGFIELGDTVTLTAPAGSGYQWVFEGSPIGGATTQILVRDAIAPNLGTYVVEYDDGTKALVQSEPFVLSAIPAGSVPAAGMMGLFLALLFVGALGLYHVVRVQKRGRNLR